MRSKKTLARGEALLYFTNSVTTASLDFEQSSSIQTWNSSSRLALDNTNLIKFISLSVQIIPTTLIHMSLESISPVHCAFRKSMSTSSCSEDISLTSKYKFSSFGAFLSRQNTDKTLDNRLRLVSSVKHFRSLKVQESPSRMLSSPT